MTPAVSVVLTTYNYGRFLAGALDSVLGQSFGDFEVIVIDDGSTDETDTVIAPYRSDRRVRYQRTYHVGASRARNIGICLAQGPLIAFLDADDVWLPHKLEQQVALFRADSDLGVVYARRLLIDADGWELEHAQSPHYRGWVLPQIFRRNFLCFSSSMVRRSAFDDVGLFDEGLPLAMDYDLWLRVALRFRFDYVDEPLVKYRTGHANLSRRSLERSRTVGFIMRRFLNGRGGRTALPSSVIRLTLAEHCCDVGSAMQGPWRAAWYLRALRYRPLHPLAWHALLAFWWPDRLRLWVRHLLGRPNWQQRQRVGAAVTEECV
jgi:glycosyltransferase involved in cell wall biosynthesis